MGNHITYVERRSILYRMGVYMFQPGGKKILISCIPMPFDDFLMGIVCNDLKKAVVMADNINMNNIVGYVKFFHNYCPSECWGSTEKVATWMAQGGMNFVTSK